MFQLPVVILKEKHFKKWQIVINDFVNACRYTPGQKMTEVVDVEKKGHPKRIVFEIVVCLLCAFSWLF